MKKLLRTPICMIMPVCNGAADILPVLESISAQIVDSPMRCVIVDNGSQDGTPEIVAAALAKGLFPGTLIRLKERSIPRALNAALQHVHLNETVIRLDAHTIYDLDYCQNIIDAFAQLPPDVWCVGGVQRPAPVRGFGRQLVYSLMTNPLGLGGAAFRTVDTSRKVSGVYLGAWRPGVLQRLGGFDARWRANEDAELSERLSAAGGKTWLVPAKSNYIITRSANATIRQWSRYGYWRAQTIKAHPRSLRLRHIIPPIALILSCICALFPARSLLFFPALVYATAIILKRRQGEPIAVTAAAIPFFACAHIAFASGLLTGLLTLRRGGTSSVLQPDDKSPMRPATTSCK